MRLIDRLERRFGKYAIPNLMAFIIFANAIVFVIQLFEPSYIDYLSLVPSKVLEGQVWRVFTFVFLPQTYNVLFFIFTLMFYYFIGSALERVWGTFYFNIYYLTGFLGIIIGSFLTGIPMTNTYLNLSLFLAFARLFPDYTLYIYFILPVKIKYLAWLDWAGFLVMIIIGDFGTRVSIILAVANYFLFFGKDIIRKRGISVVRRTTYRAKMNPKKAHFHECYVCKRTELDDPNLEFRYCSKCSGEKEYCSEHLFTHEHK